MVKTSIRKKILAKRAGIDKTFVNAASKKIYKRLINTYEYNSAKTIMFYVSKDNEVETRSMIEDTIKKSKKICVPKTDRLNHKLHPVMIKDMDSDLELGHFGLHEPRLDRGKMVPITKIDLIITPGIAFDRNGYRLGWGKGYYDRFLENTGKIPKIGLAFDFQIIPQLPRDSHDIPVDIVITEKRKIQMTKHKIQNKFTTRFAGAPKIQITKLQFDGIRCFGIWILNLFCALNFVI